MKEDNNERDTATAKENELFPHPLVKLPLVYPGKNLSKGR